MPFLCMCDKAAYTPSRTQDSLISSHDFVWPQKLNIAGIPSGFVLSTGNFALKDPNLSMIEFSMSSRITVGM